MSYQVTARKWRPQTFEDVVGQQHITKTLKNAILNKRIAHSYIFAGPRGVGKTTTARILAKSLNCLSPVEAEPCNKCEMCNSFNSSQSLDVIEIDGASNRRIEDIRSLRESVKYAPTSGKYKIYIIDEVHMLTTESFNALLKTLEEPPEHTIFIFATTDIHKVPLTIISRCQRFDFRRIELDNIKKQLQFIADNENISIDDKSLTLIAKKADGALRDAQSLFDQVIAFCGNKVESEILTQMLNLIDEDIYFDISDSILTKNFSAAFNTSKLIYENGWNYIDFMNGLNEHFRNILSVIATKSNKLIESSEANKEKYLEYASSFSEGDLLRVLNFINKTLYEVKNTQNQKLKVEISLAHLIGMEKTSTISQLLEKVNSIPEKEISLPENTVTAKPSETGEIKKKVLIEKEEKKTKKITNPEIAKEPSISLTGDVSSLWPDFVSKISAEKISLSILSDTKIHSRNANKVTIECHSIQDCDILSQNKSYLNTKYEEYYSDKIDFSFYFEKNGKEILKGKNMIVENGFATEDSETTPLMESVVKILDGRKI